MSKRYLDCTASEIQRMTGRELAESIAGSEGRVLVCETIGSVRPMLGDVTNAEFASAMGADMLILNLFDVNAPVIQGLPDVSREDTIREVKRLTGRAVGINLEPLEPDAASAVETNGEWNLTSGRAATVANARKAIEMGVDFIVLTGNPGVGVTNAAITHTLRSGCDPHAGSGNGAGYHYGIYPHAGILCTQTRKDDDDCDRHFPGRGGYIYHP